MLRQTPVQHIRQKLQEAEYFLGGVRHFSGAIDQLVAEGLDPFTPAGYPLVRQLQYHLSAMLSAFQCALNYMQRECTSDDAKRWYTKVEGQKLVQAFGALRNSDVHDETISTTHQTTIVHGVSHRSDMMLSAEALAAAKNLGARPKVVKVLTSRPIVELASEAYQHLARAVHEGYEKRRFASLPPLPMPTVPQTLSANPPRTLDDYLRCGAMNDFARTALQDAVARRRVIQIGGDSRSGKTSLLRAIVREYHTREREGFRGVLLGQGSDELLVDVPSLQIGVTDSVGHTIGDGSSELGAIFADGGKEILEAALPLWQAGAGGAFTLRNGNDTPEALTFNAIAPVSVVMVEGAVAMLFARSDDDLDGDDDNADDDDDDML